MPFRRLVQTMDEWAAQNPDVEVMAQVGNDTGFSPIALTCVKSLSPQRYAELVRSCELLVAHAGMGSVLAGLEHGKPMLLMPRRGALNETRNDHQAATLRWLRDKPGIYAVDDAAALSAALNAWRAQGLTPPPRASDPPEALNELVAALRAFIG